MYNCNYFDTAYRADYYTTVRNLQEYIHDELKDSKYYTIMAGMAPTTEAKQLLMDFSNDERGHAENFMNAYYMLTGRNYYPPVVEEPAVPAYLEAIKFRIMAETGDYKKYGEQYLKATNPYLKDLFFMTRTVEAMHAMRMPILLTDICCK